MYLVSYAVKCDISKDEVEEDMYESFEEFKKIDYSNLLEEGDIIPALETYGRQYYNFNIDDIEKLIDIRIERNKRNYKK